MTTFRSTKKIIDSTIRTIKNNERETKRRVKKEAAKAKKEFKKLERRILKGSFKYLILDFFKTMNYLIEKTDGDGKVNGIPFSASKLIDYMDKQYNFRIYRRGNKIGLLSMAFPELETYKDSYGDKYHPALAIHLETLKAHKCDSFSDITDFLPYWMHFIIFGLKIKYKYMDGPHGNIDYPLGKTSDYYKRRITVLKIVEERVKEVHDYFHAKLVETLVF